MQIRYEYKESRRFVYLFTKILCTTFLLGGHSERTMTILITGGTGNTGGPLARLLHAAKVPFLVASRNAAKSGQTNAVTLDWLNPDTFVNPFNADPNINRVYLVAPFVMNPFKPIFKPFIDFAVKKGVKRFVLLTSVHRDAGSSGLGEIHQYLIDIGVEYAVLRPSWFTGEPLAFPSMNIFWNNF